MLKLICPNCGNDNISVRTEVRWDVDKQTWVAYCISSDVEMECMDCQRMFPFNFVEVA